MSKPSVLLTMIVRNESRIIERCLESALPWIDGYYIIDTGSTDDTVSIIEKFMESNNVPGQVDHAEWINYGANRSELVRNAHDYGERYDYLLLADADMVFHGDSGDLDGITEPSYLIRLGGGFEWWMCYLVRNDLHWRYEGVTHEFLTADEPFVSTKLDGFWIEHFGDGGNRPDKFTNDRDLLRAEYERNPTDVRTVFYLAQTEQGLGNTDESISLYRYRVSLGGWEEEVYWSLYQVAEMTGLLDDYLAAWNYRPTRPEALHKILVNSNSDANHAFTVALGRYYITQPPCEDILFVERDSEDVGIPLQLAVAEWWTGEHQTAKQRFLSLLAKDISDETRELVVANLEYC